MTLKKSKRFEVDVEKDTNGSPNHIEKSFGGGGGCKDKDVTFNKNARALRLKKILTPNFPVKVVKIRQILSDVKRQ